MSPYRRQLWFFEGSLARRIIFGLSKITFVTVLENVKGETVVEKDQWMQIPAYMGFQYPSMPLLPVIKLKKKQGKLRSSLLINSITNQKSLKPAFYSCHNGPRRSSLMFHQSPDEAKSYCQTSYNSSVRSDYTEHELGKKKELFLSLPNRFFFRKYMEFLHKWFVRFRKEIFWQCRFRDQTLIYHTILYCDLADSVKKKNWQF